MCDNHEIAVTDGVIAVLPMPTTYQMYLLPAAAPGR
jgi:hypothetical protein